LIWENYPTIGIPKEQLVVSPIVAIQMIEMAPLNIPIHNV
jgi:hypothetical protein